MKTWFNEIMHFNEGTRKSNMYSLALQLWPLNRSITGSGFRESLDIIENYVGIESNRLKFASGKKVFDWQIPKVWEIKDAYIKDQNGNIFCNFRDNNLHIMGYSTPVNKVISRTELESHLFSLPKQRDAVPYVTSYYSPNWGFCISQNDREKLEGDNFEVLIDSNLHDGELEIAEWIIKGREKETIFFSTYLCHPSMANNELSGPVVMAEIIRNLKKKSKLRYTYRFVIVPETIGSIAYLSKNYKKLKKNVVAGFNLTCVGDDRMFSYLPTRQGNCYVDRIAKYVLKNTASDYLEYSWLDRGSDERQYCSPGIDLPIASLMRSKYGTYPEYHTSLDKLGTVVTPNGLEGGFEIHMEAISVLENNYTYISNVLGEPNFGKRGMYPLISIKENYNQEMFNIRNVISYCDGTNDLIEIAEKTKIKFSILIDLINKLEKLELIVKIK